jgi:hypothetical protein
MQQRNVLGMIGYGLEITEYVSYYYIYTFYKKKSNKTMEMKQYNSLKKKHLNLAKLFL